jgi:hypothetical protein
MLSKDGRPEALSHWISRGRKVWPEIEDLPGFANSLMAWWASLQPESRRQKGTKKLLQVVQIGEIWEGLRKGSINGFFTVVMGLAWWFTAIKGPNLPSAFTDMAQDVLWVQKQIIKSLQESGKRPHEEGGLESMPTKRFIYNLIPELLSHTCLGKEL